MSTKVAVFYVSDDVDSINEKLESLSLDATDVISIHHKPGGAFASSDHGGRYQVLYRQPEQAA